MPSCSTKLPFETRLCRSGRFVLSITLRRVGGRRNVGCTAVAAVHFLTVFLSHGHSCGPANPAKTVLAGVSFRCDAFCRPRPYRTCAKSSAQAGAVKCFRGLTSPPPSFAGRYAGGARQCEKAAKAAHRASPCQSQFEPLPCTAVRWGRCVVVAWWSEVVGHAFHAMNAMNAMYAMPQRLRNRSRANYLSERHTERIATASWCRPASPRSGLKWLPRLAKWALTALKNLKSKFFICSGKFSFKFSYNLLSRR